MSNTSTQTVSCQEISFDLGPSIGYAMEGPGIES